MKKYRFFFLVWMLISLPIFPSNNSAILDKSTGTKRIEILVDLAKIHRESGEYRESLQFAQEALNLAAQLKSNIYLRDVYLELTETYKRMNNLEKALENFKKYKEKNDAIFNEQSSKKIDEMKNRFEIKKREGERTLLKKYSQIQELKLTRQSNLTIIFVIIAVLVIVLAFVTYTRYRLKIRISRALSTEIDEHRKTSEELKESELKFRILAEKSMVGIYIVQDNVFKYVNPQMLSIFGYRPGEILLRDPLIIVLEQDRSMLEVTNNQIVAGVVESLNFEFRGKTKKNDPLHCEVYVTRITYQGRLALLGTLIDITDRKKTEAELLNSQKLESIGILAGGIAHDFNNLLAIILGNLSMAIEEIKDDAEALDVLKIAEKASLHAAELANKFITFSKGGWLIPQRVTLNALLRGLNEYYPHSLQMFQNIFIPQDLDPLLADERQLRQVIYNLLQNASEATKNCLEKNISLCAENIFLPGDNFFSIEGGRYVKISISDNGIGIPPAQLEKIFDPHAAAINTDTPAKDIKLGMAICYSILKKHNGHITIESKLEMGTIVNLYIPAYNT